MRKFANSEFKKTSIYRMNLAFEARVGLRYSLGHRRSRLGNFITFVSALGLVLGVTMLITVLSVMNGFDKEMRERILVVIPHIRLLQTNVDERENWQQHSEIVSSHPQVNRVSPYTELNVLLRYRGGVEPGLLYALEPAIELKDTTFSSLIGVELLSDLNNKVGIALGSGLAERLQLEKGDQLSVMLYENNNRKLRSISYEVLGVFHSGTELDQTLSVLSFDSLAKFPGQSSVPEGLRVQTDFIFGARFVGRELQNNLPLGYRVSTWEQTHGNLYEAIQMSRYLVSLIVVLILAIAAFNLIATLMIASADKQSEIAILKTLGAEPSSVARIFALQGLFIGLMGSLVGGLLGVLLSLNITSILTAFESLFGFKLLNSDVYPLDYLPSYLHWGQVGLVVFVAVCLSVLAAIYPAWRVSKIQAAQVLRYE